MKMANRKIKLTMTVSCLIAGALIIIGSLNPTLVSAGQKAVCVNAAADYSSGAFSVISVDDG